MSSSATWRFAILQVISPVRKLEVKRFRGMSLGSDELVPKLLCVALMTKTFVRMRQKLFF